MPAHSVGELNSLLVKKGPYRNPFYFAKVSFAKGPIPGHLESYTKTFTENAKKCSAALKGMPAGKEHVMALRACIGDAMRRGGR